MIRDRDEEVHMGAREPHELDMKFVHPDLTTKEMKDTGVDEAELKRFRENSLFTGEKLKPKMKLPWAGHVLISGATGVGKTWLAKELLQDDPRTIYLVSDIEGRDRSLKTLYRNDRIKREIPDDVHDAFVLFDDVRDPDQIEYRNSLAEQGRHRNITVITINHTIRGGIKLKQIIQDSEWIVLFPHANRAIITSYLRDVMHLKTRFRSALIQQAMQDGRYLFIHNWQPTFFMTEKSVIPF